MSPLIQLICCRSPDGPEPMTATFLPVRVFGGFGAAYPSAYARSMIEYSLERVATGSPFRLQVHAFSQKCRADSGCKFRKIVCLFQPVICLFPVAVINQVIPLRTGLCRGQPLAIPAIICPAWQNGTPHAIHLAPCISCSSFDRGVWNSRKCLILSFWRFALCIASVIIHKSCCFPTFWPPIFLL